MISGIPDAGSAPRRPRALGDVLEELHGVLQERRLEMPEGSYTAKLLGGPVDQLLKKIGEEATEVVMAVKDGSSERVRYEVADLLYHLLVVCVREGVTPDDLATELADRRR